MHDPTLIVSTPTLTCMYHTCYGLLILHWHALSGSEDEGEVMKAVIDVAAEYSSVGRTLGLSPSELKTIAHDCPRDCKGALSQVISAWLKQSHITGKVAPPSWRTLVEAVDSPSGGRNRALAKKIAFSHRGKYVLIMFKPHYTIIPNEHYFPSGFSNLANQTWCLFSKESSACSF